MLFVAICLACAIYARSLRGEFLFDDHAIKDMDFPRREAVISGSIDFDDPGNRASPPVPVSKMIEGWDRLRLIRLERAFRSFLLEPRALTHLGYFWTWKLCRFDPEGWHAVNLYLHCANIYLVYLVAKLFLPVFPAGVAAMIFAVHPLQVAAVSYISGRAGIQCTFFSLAALLIGAGPLPLPLWKIPGFFLAVLFAMRSKEDAVLWLGLFSLLVGLSSIWLGSI